MFVGGAIRWRVPLNVTAMFTSELIVTVGSYLEKIFKDGELVATIQEHWINDLTAEKRYYFSLCQTNHQVYDFSTVAECKDALFNRYLA